MKDLMCKDKGVRRSATGIRWRGGRGDSSTTTAVVALVTTSSSSTKEQQQLPVMWELPRVTVAVRRAWCEEFFLPW